MGFVTGSQSDDIVTIELNDPNKRNALGVEMFDGLDAALTEPIDNDSARVVLLRGAGKAFCAGFDLQACVDEPRLMADFIRRLSGVTRKLRRLPQPVVAAVHGAAIAGGCALLSACDFVLVEQSAKLGYPVHRIGVSPAVTLPTLAAAIGYGPARSLVMSGELIDGTEAARIGLATEVLDGKKALDARAKQLCQSLAIKPPGGLQTTKAWLNELDGSLDDGIFDRTAKASADLATSEEAVSMLQGAWTERSR